MIYILYTPSDPFIYALVSRVSGCTSAATSREFGKSNQLSLSSLFWHSLASCTCIGMRIMREPTNKRKEAPIRLALLDPRLTKCGITGEISRNSILYRLWPPTRFHLLTPPTWNLSLNSYKYGLPNQVFSNSNPIHIHPRCQRFTVIVTCSETNWDLNHCQDGLRDRLKPIQHTYQDAHQETQALLWPQDWLQHSFQQAGRELFT